MIPETLIYSSLSVIDHPRSSHCKWDCWIALDPYRILSTPLPHPGLEHSPLDRMRLLLIGRQHWLLCSPPSPSGRAPPGRSSCSLASGTEDKEFHDRAPVLQAPCAHTPSHPPALLSFQLPAGGPTGSQAQAQVPRSVSPSLSSGILCVLPGQPRLPRFQRPRGKGQRTHGIRYL